MCAGFGQVTSLKELSLTCLGDGYRWSVNCASVGFKCIFPKTVSRLLISFNSSRMAFGLIDWVLAIASTRIRGYYFDSWIHVDFWLIMHRRRAEVFLYEGEKFQLLFMR